MVVGECMVPFKGHSSMRQYISMKPVKRGYKVWCLADLRTGFVSQFDVYSGRKDMLKDSSFCLGESMVLSLCNIYVQAQRLIAFDSFFTSYQLMKTVNKRGLFAVCKLRASRKGLRDILKRKDQIEHGEFMFHTKGCGAAIKWQDNKSVTILSTYHSPKEISCMKQKNRDDTSSIIACSARVAEYVQ
jgi:hypothetical protein